MISKGWGRGVNREGGLLQKSDHQEGGELIREGDLIEKGGLIELLR